MKKKAILCLIWLFATCSLVYSSEFTIVVLPDTQVYSERYPEIFTSQTQWIVDNKDTLNIKFVVHVGDIVNHGGLLKQWDNANYSMSIMDGEVPYLVIPGNHDYNDKCAGLPRNLSNFNHYFPHSRFEGYEWYGGHYPLDGNQNNYGFFETKSEEYIVLGLEFCPTNATIEWANNVLDRYPGKKVILFTHLFMHFDNTRSKPGDRWHCDTYGCSGGCNTEDIWNRIILSHPNVVFVTSGHVLGNGQGERTDYVDGHPVYQVLQNYQFLRNGGNGLLKYYTFKPGSDNIRGTTYSPYTHRGFAIIDYRIRIRHILVGLASMGAVVLYGIYKRR